MMSIKPICNFCGKEIEKAGGLGISPPKDVDDVYFVRKIHICRKCWKEYISENLEDGED